MLVNVFAARLCGTQRGGSHWPRPVPQCAHDHPKAALATAAMTAMHTRFSTSPQRIIVACGT